MEADDRRQLQEAVDNSVCGIMVELVQGEGGVAAIDKGYAKYVEEVCKENDILFLVDEVQTSIGRTGTLLCSEQYHIRPNIITLAKGLGGGLPIGAVLMDEVAGEILGLGIAEQCAENGLLILTAKKKLRIMPPLNITLDEIDKGLDILRRCLSGFR